MGFPLENADVGNTTVGTANATFFDDDEDDGDGGMGSGDFVSDIAVDLAEYAIHFAL